METNDLLTEDNSRLPVSCNAAFVLRQVNRSGVPRMDRQNERNGRFKVEIYVGIKSVPTSKHTPSQL
jgi:hypothetical protein